MGLSTEYPGWLLLEDALSPEDGIDDGRLYQAALAVEQDHALMAEMAEWEVAAIDDGLSDRGRVPPQPPADPK
jgi:hypothetical protein